MRETNKLWYAKEEAVLVIVIQLILQRHSVLFATREEPTSQIKFVEFAVEKLDPISKQKVQDYYSRSTMEL